MFTSIGLKRKWKNFKEGKVDAVQTSGGEQLISKYSSSNASPLSHKGRKATPSTNQYNSKELKKKLEKFRFEINKKKQKLIKACKKERK